MNIEEIFQVIMFLERSTYRMQLSKIKRKILYLIIF